MRRKHSSWCSLKPLWRSDKVPNLNRILGDISETSYFKYCYSKILTSLVSMDFSILNNWIDFSKFSGYRYNSTLIVNAVFLLSVQCQTLVPNTSHGFASSWFYVFNWLQANDHSQLVELCPALSVSCLNQSRGSILVDGILSEYRKNIECSKDVMNFPPEFLSNLVLFYESFFFCGDFNMHTDAYIKKCYWFFKTCFF